MVAPSVAAPSAAPASVAPLADQPSVAPLATPQAEVVLASLVRPLVDSVAPSQKAASVETLVAKANSPLVVPEANSKALANSLLVARTVLPSLLEEANSPLVVPEANSERTNLVAKDSSPLAVVVDLPSTPAEASSASANAVPPSLLAEANSLLVAEAAPSVVLSVPRVLALPHSAPRAVELNSDNSVVALMSQEVSRVPLTPSAVNPLEDVRLLLLELTLLRAVPLELEPLLLKVRLKALVLSVSMASPMIPSTLLPEDPVVPALRPSLLMLLLSVQEDLLLKDNVVASRLISAASTPVLIHSSTLVPLLSVPSLDRLPFSKMPLSLADALLILVPVAEVASPVDSVLALPSVLEVTVASDVVTRSPTESSMTEDAASSVVPAVPSSVLASADVVWTDVVPTCSTISDRLVASTPAVKSTRREAILAIFPTSVVLKASLALVASRPTLPTDQASQVSMAVKVSTTDSVDSVTSAPTRTSVVSVVLDKRPRELVLTADSTSVAPLSVVASVPTPPLDVSTPSAAPVVSVDSTRTSPQEVTDSNKSVVNSSLLASMPPADLTDLSRDSAAARLSQVVPPRHPSSVSRRVNSSVREATSELDSPPEDPHLRLFPSEDARASVSERPPSPRDSTTVPITDPLPTTTAATTELNASTTAATTDLNPSTTAASADPASVASAAREVATVATDGESISTDKEQTGLSVISDIELFLNTLCSLVELLYQPCVLRAKGYKNLPKLRKKIISTNHFFI